MAKIERPRGLIRYASLNSIERGEPLRWTGRMSGYAAVLAVLIGLFLFLILTRSNVEATLLRAPGAMFEQLPNGNLVNLYTLQLVNKTSQPMPVQLKLEDIAGKLSIMGDPKPVVPGEQLVETPILIELAPALLRNGPRRFNVGVYSQGRRLQTVHTTFIGPRG
jgi:polyferredoxin